MVSIIRDSFGSSPNTRRNSEMERLSTSSETNVFGHTVCKSSSLVMDSPARWDRHTSTSITLGSRRVDVPFSETLFRLGWTSQGPTRKSLSTTSSGKLSCGIIYRIGPTAHQNLDTRLAKTSLQPHSFLMTF